MRQFLLYAVIRLGLWVLIWWALTQLDIGLMLAGVLAALIAMLVSIVFLDRLRDAAAMRWKAADERRAERRGPDVDEDAEYEDSMLDGLDEDGRSGVTSDAAGTDAVGADAAGTGEGDDAAGAAAGPTQLPGFSESGSDEPGLTQPDRD